MVGRKRDLTGSSVEKPQSLENGEKLSFILHDSSEKENEAMLTFHWAKEITKLPIFRRSDAKRSV